MSIFGAEPNRSAPESWVTVSYSVRRPGNAAWEQGLATFKAAQESRREADQVVRGHRIYAEQEYIGTVSNLIGSTRSVERS